MVFWWNTLHLRTRKCENACETAENTVTAVTVFPFIKTSEKRRFCLWPCPHNRGTVHSVLEAMLLPRTALGPLAFCKLERTGASQVQHRRSHAECGFRGYQLWLDFFAFSLSDANALCWGGTLRRNWNPSAAASTAISLSEDPLGMQAGPQADCTKNRNKTLQNSML